MNKQCKNKETNKIKNEKKQHKTVLLKHFKNNLLHSQSVLAYRFPAVLVAAGFLLKEEALREPKGAVFSLSASNQHAYHKDDQKEERGHPHQHQLDPIR